MNYLVELLNQFTVQINHDSSDVHMTQNIDMSLTYKPYRIAHDMSLPMAISVPSGD